MKILHLIPTLSGGGAERQLNYLANELIHAGHEVHICYLNDGIDKPSFDNVILHHIKAKSNYSPFILWQLILTVRKIKPDIIQSWMFQMDVLGSIVANLFKIPFLLREPTSSLYYIDSIKDRIRVSLSANASIIVSNSLGGDEYWKEKLPTSKRIVIRNGLPFKLIQNVEPIVSTFILNIGSPFILYVGRLIESKNLTSLLKSMAFIHKKYDFQLVICGDGEQKLELKALSKELDIMKNVYFVGHLASEDIFALMKRASLFVSLSNYEGCPNTVTEAMACGSPIIVSDIPAHHEILDNDSALFVKNDDVSQIAEAIMKIFDNQEETIKRAIIAKKKTNEWSVSEMAKKYESVYQSILK